MLHIDRYSLDMTKGPWLKKILIFSLPLMCTSLLQMVYSTADVIVVGRFAGAASLAAVGAATPLINLILNFFFGLATGAGVISARHIGAKDEQKLSESVHTSMLLSILSGVLISVFGFIFAEEMLTLMNTPEDVLEFSTLYLQIYLLGAPASLIYNFGSSIIRSTGDTKRPLYILTSTGLINVILNLVFVIFFRMGVSGVAIATIISQYISALLTIIRLMKIEGGCRLYIGKLRLHAEELKQVLLIGIPAGLQSALFSFSNVIIQSTVNSFGSTAVSGITASANIDDIIYVCTNAVAQTTMTFTSQNIGAKKLKNVGTVYTHCLLITIVLGTILNVICYVFRYEMMGIFSTDTQVIAAGAERLATILPLHIFCSLMDVGACQLRGMGRSIEPMIITLLGSCGLRILWVYTVFPINPTLNFLYTAYPISWTLTFVVLFIFYFIIKRKITKKKEM